MNIIKTIYNFLVGDMVILVGVILTILVLALINSVAFLAPLRPISGVFLVIAILLTLLITLGRELLASR